MRVPKMFPMSCFLIVSILVLCTFHAPETHAQVAGQSPAPAPTQTPIPRTCNAGADQAIRLPDAANVRGSSSGFTTPSYYWLPQAGVTYGNDTSAVTTISFSDPGVYTIFFRCREPNGFYILDNLMITVNPPVFDPPLPISSAFVANYATDDVWVIDTTKAKVVAAVNVGDAPMDILARPDGKKVYVANFGSSNISIIDTSTLAVETITTSRSPLNLAISPDGSILFVSNYYSNLVTFISTATNQPLATVPIVNPRGLAVKRDGSRLYVASYLTRVVSEIDIANPNATPRTITLPGMPISLAISEDNSKLYAMMSGMNYLSVINTGSFANPTTLPLGHYPNGMNISPNGKWLSTVSTAAGTASWIDTSTNSVLNTFYVGNKPSALAISQDSSRMYTASFDNNNVAFVNTPNQFIVAGVGVNRQPKAIALLEPRGLALYFKFDEDTNRLKDYSGNNNNGEILGNVPWGTGFIGNAFSFDGIATNKIRVPHSSSIDITGQEVTISAWIKVRACPANGVYGEIVKHLQTTTLGGFQLELNGTPQGGLKHPCTIRFNYKGGDDDFTSGNGIVLEPGEPGNRWYHVAGGKTATHIWTAINGEIDLYDDSIGSILPNTQPLIVGGQVSAGSGGTTFDGLIDEVMVFNRALSVDEIRNIYLNGLRH